MNQVYMQRELVQNTREPSMRAGAQEWQNRKRIIIIAPTKGTKDATVAYLMADFTDYVPLIITPSLHTLPVSILRNKML
jgi:hypothetical protein